MKNKIVLSIIIFITFLFPACEVVESVYDIDETSDVSDVSVKPLMVLNGEEIISLQKEESKSYVDAGVKSSEVKLGENDLAGNTSIFEGEVKPGEIGFYAVTYKSTNSYGWTSYKYRSVLIYESNPYGDDIYGEYKCGLKGNGTISKYEKAGYWQSTNIWDVGVIFPIIFAQDPNGGYSIVPGEHPTKGRYTGYAEKVGANKIKFTLDIVSPDGLFTHKEFTWKRK